LKIVVTGGAGFIGANLCRELLSRPEVERVVAIDDMSTGHAENVKDDDIELVEGSILDQRLLASVIDGAHAVVHLAARPSVARSVADPVASHNVNATGTLYVLEACRFAKAHVVAASSSSVYGPTETLPKHENLPVRPQSPYAASKMATESYVLAYAASYMMSTLPFRFFNVYGPFQSPNHAYAAVVPSFIDAALKRKPLQINGDGKQTRDFTYVGSVVKVLAEAAISRVGSHSPVNLAFGTCTTILDLAAQIEKQLDRRLEYQFTVTRPGDLRDSQAAHSRLRTLFPGSAEVTLDDGLRETIEWFKNLPGNPAEAAGLSMQAQPTS
jgi:UDP-glucose 4-epimerase